jgi:putative DNA methylase
VGKEIITRRHLPHWYVPGAAHFVTYRLAGTMPVEVLHALREERGRLMKREPPAGRSDAQQRERAHKRFFAGYDQYLDSHREVDWLARPEVAAMVRRNLYHHQEELYHLLAYCITPNHVHALLQPMDCSAVRGEEARFADERPDARSPLARIMHSLKSYTAHKANKLLGTSGQFWQHESYDHWVRDDQELAGIVDYIRWNPVGAGLTDEPHHWFWGSAHDRFLSDGAELGLISYPAEEFVSAPPCEQDSRSRGRAP